MKKKILVVDDDDKLRGLLSDYLVKYGFEVKTLPDGEKLLSTLRMSPPDLIVLDIMLPGQTGLELCKEVRKVSPVPIIMLTARGDVNDRIVGLELGADDYLPKPFEPRELVARIDTILRRASHAFEKKVLLAGELELELEAYVARLNGTDLDLTTKEFEVLALFAQNPRRVFSREDLMESIRGIDWDAFNRSIDVLVSRLRNKLGDDPKKPRYISTVWGSGYKFIGFENSNHA